MQQLHSASDALQWLRAHACTGLSADSRSLQAGDAFVAWPGAASDARAYVRTALQAGAAACLVELEGVERFGFQDPRVAGVRGLKAVMGALAAAFFGHPSQALALVGITGTNGKTSVAWWLAQAFTALAPGHALPCGMVGTLGIGRPMGEVLPSGLTTPDPVTLQRALRGFVQQGLRACAMEASSIGIEEGRLDGCYLACAVFTNFTQDHLDYHGSMEAYWQAKRRLFDWPGLPRAVVCVDDAQGATLARELQARAQPGLDLWTYSVQAPARLQARALRYLPQGMVFDVVEGQANGSAATAPEIHTLQTPLIGSYNVANLLGVIATLRAFGVPLADAVAACAQLQPVPGRMECQGGHGAPLVAVDYAHTPDALDNALQALRPVATARAGALWCVFGCGGNRDSAKRPLMGAIASRHADRVVVTSDNPRREKPEAILAQILLGLPDPHHVEVQADRAQAIAQAIAQAQAQDVVLIAGKGHEDTQEIAGVKTPFSDRLHAQAALQARGTPHRPRVQELPCTP